MVAGESSRAALKISKSENINSFDLQESIKYFSHFELTYNIIELLERQIARQINNGMIVFIKYDNTAHNEYIVTFYDKDSIHEDILDACHPSFNENNKIIRIKKGFIKDACLLVLKSRSIMLIKHDEWELKIQPKSCHTLFVNDWKINK